MSGSTLGRSVVLFSDLHFAYLWLVHPHILWRIPVKFDKDSQLDVRFRSNLTDEIKYSVIFVASLVSLYESKMSFDDFFLSLMANKLHEGDRNK